MKREPHQIKLEDIETYSFENIVAASHGMGSCKELIAVVEGKKVTFQVTNNREFVSAHDELRDAAEVYNSLP